MKHTQGSVAIEFLIGGALVLLIILGLIQMLLLYQGAIQLQQATFEAARAGIVNNGTKSSITKGFIQNSLDIHGGGQNSLDLARSYQRALVAVNTPLAQGGAGFQLRILNPTLEAFEDWGQIREDDKRYINNAWLDAKPDTVGIQSGVSIQDANILKIEITYGLPLYMPFIDRIIGKALEELDPQRREYYRSTPVRLPIRSTAVMHMQSDIQEDEPVSLQALIRL